MIFKIMVAMIFSSLYVVLCKFEKHTYFSGIMDVYNIDELDEKSSFKYNMEINNILISKISFIFILLSLLCSLITTSNTTSLNILFLNIFYIIYTFISYRKYDYFLEFYPEYREKNIELKWKGLFYYNYDIDETFVFILGKYVPNFATKGGKRRGIIIYASLLIIYFFILYTLITLLFI